jgi:hypothetical protein
VQQFLQAEKIPRRLGRVGRVRRVGNAFQRRIEEQRENNKRDRKQFDGQGCAEVRRVTKTTRVGERRWSESMPATKSFGSLIAPP